MSVPSEECVKQQEIGLKEGQQDCGTKVVTEIKAVTQPK